MRPLLCCLLILSACSGPADDAQPAPAPAAATPPPGAYPETELRDLIPQEPLPEGVTPAAVVEALPEASEEGAPDAGSPPPDASTEAEGQRTSAAPPPAPTPRAEPPPPGAERGAPASTAPVQLERGVLAEAIVDRQPKNEGDSFDEGSRVYFFNQLSNPDGRPVRVEHVWFRGDEERNRIGLDVKAASWRTWSYSTCFGPGAWRVELRGPDGAVLATRAFTVR